MIQLVLLSLKTHRFRSISMVRNFFLFFINSKIARVFSIFQTQLKLGSNVRIQRFSNLQMAGANAEIRVGSHSIVYERAVLEAVGQGRIQIGDCTVLGDCRISACVGVTLGRRVLVSWNVFIQDYDSHPLDPLVRGEQVKRICRRFFPRFSDSVPLEDENVLLKWTPTSSPIDIGDDVWLGAGAIILKGVKLGDGCVVASGSVVTSGTYPPRSLLAGNPARIVRVLHDGEVFL